MVRTQTIQLMTDAYCQMILITGQVEEMVKASGLQNGMVTVMSLHTTTGIAVNEALECLEDDIGGFLARIIPEDYPYAHARMLKDYGSTAGNPTGHLKAHITGNHTHFPVIDGRMIRGGAQDIYFCEFDGPAQRNILVILEGE